MFIELVVAASVAFVLGVGVSAYRALQARRVRVARTLARGRRVAIADFPEAGSATVQGRVSRCQRLSEGPFSGEPCVYYRVLVEGPERVGKSPLVLLERAAGADFYVEDESGRALVSVAGADSAVTKQAIPHRTVVACHGDRLLADVDTQGLSDEQLRYQEGRLSEGQVVVVHGVGHWETSPHGVQSGDYRTPPKRLRIAAPLTISDGHREPDDNR